MVKEFSTETKRKAKKHFAKYGSITDCATKKTIDRKTVASAIANGQATEEVVKKITEYLEEVA